MKKVLEVKNVSKIYKMYDSNFDRLREIFTKNIYHKEFIANDDISFELQEGETLGIIGLNGAGKSTILKIIAGVIEPTTGTVLKYGKVTALLELGTGFNDQMTGRENIFLNGTLIGMTQEECEANLQNIIEFSELGVYIDETITTYSSGMKMRLAFSIAIFSEPQILIVDEALSVGDAHFSAKCTKALKQRKEKNMSIIYVSHDLNSLKLLCDRAILLNRGRVIENGSPESVINQYNFFISKLNDEYDKMSFQEDNPNSYGTFDIEIKNVELKTDGVATNSIVTGNLVDIEIEIYSKIDIPNVTVGIHIRDKFGQDIYGTNTYYQKKVVELKKDRRYLCSYSMKFNIGTGKYTLGVAIHTQDWHTEKCFHWIDNAVEFEIMGTRENLFIGLCKLEPSINIKEYKKEIQCVV